MIPLLAQISGDVFVHFVVYIIGLGLIFWLLWWLISFIPEPFKKVASVILAVAAVLILIDVLMGLVGHPLVRF